MIVKKMSVERSSVSVRRDARALKMDVGIGLKPEFFQEIMMEKPNIGFFEIHAENYMVAGGPFHAALTEIAKDYPISIHGVGLSLGSGEPLDTLHLTKLKALLDRYQPILFSEHLAWSRFQGQFLNDLLPLPYTKDSLVKVCEHIDQTQTFLGRQILIENPATYLTFQESSFSETDFIQEVLQRTGCGLLLDINNVYVSSINHGWDPQQYLEAIDLSSVQEIHLAGHAQEQMDSGETILIDSHGAEIAPAVWSLYEFIIQKAGAIPTLIERDQNIPPLSELMREISIARACIAQTHKGACYV